MAAFSSSSSNHLHTNRLVEEKSPYLLQHAHNPVDWYPWGEEAFSAAREQNKPIFLSVGYSTCHWCHVMERETFNCEQVAALLKANFISVKLDREERPDVDKVYMTFVQATMGGGGWPLSVWLTPDLKPIVGGTYFPPDDRYYGRPGFKTILTRIAQQWKQKQGDIENQGTKIVDALRKAVEASDNSDSAIPDTVFCNAKLFDSLEKNFDEEHGGFGNPPKFPQPVNFGALFRIFFSDKEGEMGARALQMSLHTLTCMANGGIHDHISQGFHRYSTDKSWHVPHFEKMLYDQAQLAVAYCQAFQITKDTFYADVARDIFQYVSRDLSHKEGGFLSAEDADSLPTALAEEKKEGAFCVWMWGELHELLAEDAASLSKEKVTLADVFCHYYGAKETGNVDPLTDPHDELKLQNVLSVSSTVEDTALKFGMSESQVSEALVKCRSILYNARQLRPKPHLDDKMVAAWNGLMISAYAIGGQALGDPALTSRAVQAAQFLRQHMVTTGDNEVDLGLARSCYTCADGGVAQGSRATPGFLEDYTCVVRGLIDLYEAMHDEQWLLLAEQLQEKQIQLFWDGEGGGFYSTTLDDQTIILRMKEDQDGAEPSPNSLAALNLLRLAAMLNKPEWQTLGERVLRVFADRLLTAPTSVPELCSALHFYQGETTQIIIVGDREAADTQALVKAVHGAYLPNKVLLVTSGQDSRVLHRLTVLPALVRLEGCATAYLCRDSTCRPPTTCPDQLRQMLS